MIRINLLPVRASKKKETIRQQVSVAALSVVGVLAIGLGLYAMTLAKISSTKEKIASSEQELTALKAKIGTIDNIRKLQAEVKKKLDVLNQLRKEKSGPASRLAALSDSVPEQLWLVRYVETGPNVSISGFALNEDLIAQFMNNLQMNPAFGNVELQVSEQTEIAGVKAKRFEVSFLIKGKE